MITAGLFKTKPEGAIPAEKDLQPITQTGYLRRIVNHRARVRRPDPGLRITGTSPNSISYRQSNNYILLPWMEGFGSSKELFRSELH
jgi:hypothetical protein